MRLQLAHVLVDSPVAVGASSSRGWDCSQRTKLGLVYRVDILWGLMKGLFRVGTAQIKLAADSV
jgi:hypothetical protein